MNNVLPSPVSVQVAGGLVAASERRHADELVASLCGLSNPARGRLILFAHTEPDGSTAASADAILVLHEYRLLCAGAVGRTMHEAIETLEARLDRQMTGLREHEHALTQPVAHRDGDAGRKPARRHTAVGS